MPPSDVPVSELDAHTGYWLRAVSNAVSHRFARNLAGEGVTVAEWVVLRALLGRDGVPPNEVADALKLTRGAVSKLAERLERKRLVERRAAVGDRRSHLLSLTADGSRLVPRLAEVADDNDRQFFDGLAGEDRRALDRVLRELVDRHRIAAVPID